MPLSYRYYLADAVFVAGVEGDKQLLAGLDDALAEPKFPLYLGRRSCPPAREIRMGIRSGDVVSVLRNVDWQAAQWHRRRQSRVVDLPLVVDAGALPEPAQQSGPEEVVRDVPISFNPVRRDYGWRDVRHADPVQIQNPEGMHAPDFLAALGGG
jgi:CRISPR system Cascade subunit CasD